MSSAKVFKSGNSQAVRLPKQFRVKRKELDIERRGDQLVLREQSLVRGKPRKFLIPCRKGWA